MRNESIRPTSIKLFAGWRVNRKTRGSKRWASKWANRDPQPPAARRHPGHRLRDQAVRARRLPRPALLRPHAPLPAGPDAARRLGTVSVPVNHRPRSAGSSKYNNLNRAWSASRPARRGLADQAQQAHRAVSEEIRSSRP
jgi:dolichol-phosphate mannosyltransferase